ncbi:MAG: ABC transporter ATP-binding protein [Actinomycetota bacterium]
MGAALAFEHVTKRYRGARRYVALREDLARVVRRALRRAEPIPPIIAVDDVSFEVPEGQALGLIGDNGAGKTTLLKLATRITYPTTGRIRVRGRVGALIEIGTGLHPELTGRENVQLYGRILGLTGRDVAKRFDRIVEFAGVESAIDQPVKQFSSGMQLRLGFSLASHLEPDVLLVDEAIAVGDAAFQFRCIERMHELTQEGRTLVLVSHDMRAIQTVCTRTILLRGGRVAMDGPSGEVVERYLEDSRRVIRPRVADDEEALPNDDGVEIAGFELLDPHGDPTREVDFDDPVSIRISLDARRRVEHPMITFEIKRPDGVVVTNFSNYYDGFDVGAVEGRCTLEGWLPPLRLVPDDYEIRVLVWMWGGGRVEHGLLASRPIASATFGHFRVRGPSYTPEVDGVFQVPARRWRFKAGGTTVEHVAGLPPEREVRRG